MTFAQAGASVVQQALGSLAPVLVATFGLSKAQLGVAFTSLMLGSMLFTATAGLLTDRWGERLVMLCSAIVMTVALVLAPLRHSYAWLVAWIGVYGAAYAAITPAGGRAILSWFDRDRGIAMGIRQTGVPVGGFAGALVLPVLAAAFGLHGAFFVAAAVLLVPSLIAFALYREASDEPRVAQSLHELARGMQTLARDPRLVAVTLTCMILVGVQLAMNAFVTITGVAVVGTSAALAALAFACAQGAAAAGRLFWGFASDRFFGGDRLVPFAIICVMAAGAAWGLALLAPGAVAALFVCAVVLGLSGAGWNGLMAAAMAEVGGVERAASALGLALTAMFAASAVAPTAFGALADHSSLHVAWALTGALALLAVAPVLWLRAHQTAPLRRSPSREG